MRDFEMMDNVIETGGSGIIIGAILYLFAFIACPPFLLPLVWRSQKQLTKQVKGGAKARRDLKSLR